MRNSTFWSRNVKNLILLGAALVAIVVVFFLQFTVEVEGPNDDVLFGALQFLLALTIGWLSQSIAAKEELQRNLQEYAIVAWRRISDIRSSVGRMQRAIRSSERSVARGKVEFGAVRAIAEEMSYSVASSMDDWADMIGPDDLEKEDTQKR